MKLVQLTMTGLARLGGRSFRFHETGGVGPRPVTLITGGPRSGKTSLLRAIIAAKEAVGAYGAAAHPLDLVGPVEGGRIDCTWHLSPAEQAATGEPKEIVASWDLESGDLPEVSPPVRSVFATFLRRPDRSKVELFSARRSLDTSDTSPLLPPATDSGEGRLRLRHASTKYGGLLRMLHDSTAEQASNTIRLVEQRGVALRSQLPDSLSAVKSAIAKVCPTLRLVSVDLRERLRPLVWFQTNDGDRVEMAQLSDSELQGFLFAATFAWLGLHHSIVLIDTPELHIHPAEQARFFQAICDLGTDNQIIAATTSPAILSSVPPEQIIDLSRVGDKREN